MCMAGIARIALFVVNFLLWLCGVVGLGVGIWMKIDATIVNYLHVVNVHHSDPLINHAAIIFIVVGGVALIVGFVGCLGAIRRSQMLLFVYAALLIILVLGQAAGCALTVMYKMNVETYLENSMIKQVKTKYDTGATKQAWDYLQIQLSCCGGANFTDYQGSLWYNNTNVNSTSGAAERHVPIACCKQGEDGNYKQPVAEDDTGCQGEAGRQQANGQLHGQGCYDALADWFSSKSLMLLIIAFAIVFIEIACIVVAIWLRGALKRDKSQV